MSSSPELSDEQFSKLFYNILHLSLSLRLSLASLPLQNVQTNAASIYFDLLATVDT